MEIKYQNKYEVLTENGFKSFSGIKKTQSKTIIITFSDNSILECTENHLIKNDDKFTEANKLNVDDVIGKLTITNISKLSTDEKYVYDLLDVADGHHYITNNVTSHNCAHLDNWTEFYTSVYPTISSGKESKIVLVSTPLGMNYYYKLWMDAINGLSEYIPIKVIWSDVPGRDEEWKRQQISNTSQEQFIQEHEAEFVGSAGTLIDGWRLKEIFEVSPIKFSKTMRQFKEYVEGNNYVIVADVSRGKGIDNSAFIVVDVTAIPYEIVTTYYCNNIAPDLFAEPIYQASVYYKGSYVLVENNDAGCQTLQVLNDTYECENIMGTITNTQNQKIISVNGGVGFEFGVRTTKTVKAVGASRLKLLVEQYSLIFGCSWVIDEMNKFIRVGKSYEAQKEAHDDLVMCTLLFSWLTTQDLFEDITLTNANSSIRLQNEERLANEMMPIGYVLDGLDSYGDDSISDFMSIQLPDYDEYLLNYKNVTKAEKKDLNSDDEINYSDFF